MSTGPIQPLVPVVVGDALTQEVSVSVLRLNSGHVTVTCSSQPGHTDKAVHPIHKCGQKQSELESPPFSSPSWLLPLQLLAHHRLSKASDDLEHDSREDVSHSLN